ncbi:hypothetical protein M409DRAFT_31150 [Zasmidium cellare ATCC 36951]|uniref:Uncharacterized protein n=1 Tax=Zasmidium cellare ATCC 36951 TaxID=1080233 RepID=A0A6A6BWA7_ZASCE|nr:uncharacterized protein M409DRAFT_31150 [Zasmidium cellare ATCC 36951]KAF2158318.1 hypothetical protein M409DRAFT_31150 [Zasmidium cellare ATCC 36951]
MTPQTAADAQSRQYMRARGSGGDTQSSDQQAKKQTQNRFVHHRERPEVRGDGFQSGDHKHEASGTFPNTTATTADYQPFSIAGAIAPQTCSTDHDMISQWQQAMVGAGVDGYVYPPGTLGEEHAGPYMNLESGPLVSNSGGWDGRSDLGHDADKYFGLFTDNVAHKQRLGGYVDPTPNGPMQGYPNQGMGLDYISASSSMIFDAHAMANAYKTTTNASGEYYFGGAFGGGFPTDMTASDRVAPPGMRPSLNGATPPAPASRQAGSQPPPAVQSASTGDDSSQSRPSQVASLESRMAYILQQAALVGFKNLDALAAEYYTANFRKTSALFSDQTLSRIRRLPELIATIQRAAKEWTEWEQKGYQEEIVKGAEELLLAEWMAFKNCPRFSEWMELVSKPNNSTEETVKVKQILQDEAPNLWGLNSSLLGTGINPHRNNQVRATLNTIKPLVGIV